jgi:porin
MESAKHRRYVACCAGLVVLFLPAAGRAQSPPVQGQTAAATMLVVPVASVSPALPGPPDTAPASKGATAQPDPDASGASWAHRDRMTGDWDLMRNRLDAAGVKVSGWSIADVSGAAGAGARRGGAAAARGLLDVDVTFDLAKLLKVQGGTVFLQYFGNVGQNGAERLDAYQSFSNIDADRFHHVGELWYEQWLPGRKARFKVGRVDANSEFARVENGSEFINASMGYSPTISALPTYPSPAWSANLFVYPSEHLYVGAGAYARRPGDGDADADDAPAARRAFLIAEAGLKWTVPVGALRGRVGVGAWYEPASWQSLSGEQSHFAAAPFVVFDHDLWRRRPEEDDDASGLGLFAQYGRAAAGQAEAVRHLGLGVRWNGPFAGRDDDVAGVGLTAIQFSPLCPDRSGRELAFGPFYQWQATGWMAVKPDVQVVRNAGGSRPGAYSVAVTLRFRVEM